MLQVYARKRVNQFFNIHDGPIKCHTGCSSFYSLPFCKGLCFVEKARALQPHLCEAVLRGEPDVVSPDACHVQRRLVADHHGLGLTCGATGKDEVGQPVEVVGAVPRLCRHRCFLCLPKGQVHVKHHTRKLAQGGRDVCQAQALQDEIITGGLATSTQVLSFSMGSATSKAL